MTYVICILYFLGGHLDNYHCQSGSSILPPASPPYKDKEKGVHHTGGWHIKVTSKEEKKTTSEIFYNISVDDCAQGMMDANTDYGQSLHLLKKSVKLRPKQPKMSTHHHYLNTY